MIVKMETLRQEQMSLHVQIQDLSRQINKMSLDPKYPKYLLEMHIKKRIQLCNRYKYIYKITTRSKM